MGEWYRNSVRVAATPRRGWPRDQVPGTKSWPTKSCNRSRTDVHVDASAPSTTESALQLELENGSRIASLPGKEETVRGFSRVKLLIADEASRVANDLYLAVRPMLAVSGGRLLALSTPFGTRGWWYEAWRSQEAWERYEVPAHESRPSSSTRSGEPWDISGSPRNYECEYAEAESQPFSRQDIERAFQENVE
jgi:hypothetical protein